MEIEDFPIDEAERKKLWEKLHDVKFEITYASVNGEEETLKV